MADLEMKAPNPELEMLKLNKEGGYNYRERRQEDWRENYALYRDKVTVNRLTQRQSVNVPLMKQTIRTLLKDVDDMPVLYYESLNNDKQKEKFLNEYWKWTMEFNNTDRQDIVDKRQVFMYGRSFDQWQIVDGRIKMTVQDPQDILVSRYTDPTNLHSSRFLIHTHIYRSLSELKANSDYDKQALADLEAWYKSEQGLIKVADNEKMATEKNKKLEDMGVDDVDEPTLGEAIFEITMHFVKRDEGDGEQIYLYVEAEDQVILMKKPLEEVIGKTKDNFWQTHFPYASWADDIERQDFWSDAIADIVRTPNKVLNSWFSQLVENRTLRNFGMHYYDTTANEGNWSPNTYNPTPWGWYGVPGDPNKIVKKVDIPDLSESLDEMQFVIAMTEKATGATATQQGNVSERQITLGEVQLALGEAKERIKGMSKFYTPAWRERGMLFLKLIEASPESLDAVKIYSKGRNTSDLYEMEISPKDWKDESGYVLRIWSQDEKDANDSETLQKLNAAVTLIPGNQKLVEVYQRKLLEYADLTPEETNEVMEEEKAKMQMVQDEQNMMAQPAQEQPQPQQQVAPPPVMAPPPPAPKKTPKKKKSDKSVKKLKTLRKKIKENA